MSERLPIRARGRVTAVHKEDQLFEITMANGYRSYGVLERKGPRPPREVAPTDCDVVTEYSPFDMSRCKIVEWEVPPVD